jgi:transposase
MFNTNDAAAPKGGSEPSERERRLEDEVRKLRSYNQMLEAENKTLLKRVSELVGMLATETNQDKQLALALELKILQDRINARNRDLFGTKSEKRGRPIEVPPAAPKVRKKKRTGSTRTEQPDLPTAHQLHLLDEADQICPGCGGTLHAKAGRVETRERIVVTERVYTVVTDEMQVYGCGGCGASDTALAPIQLVPGGRYDSSIAINTAVDKYADHQPLNRQVATMRRAGLIVSRQSLWDQLNALATLCEPSYQALQAWMLDSHDLLHADETTWRMMLKGGSTKWWLWAIAADDAFFCTVSPTRSAKAARGLLRDFDGALMTDAYTVYNLLAKEAEQDTLELDTERPWHPRFRHAVCWSHARRPFEKASKSHDEANPVLDYIAQLYAIEARARDQADGDPKRLREVRADLRARESAPVLAAIKRWRHEQRALPGTQLHTGLTFLKNQWEKLTRFLDDPILPLDNNFAERQVRSPVMGRRNHLGSHSERGAHVSALFYSLIGSCRLVKVSPLDYLTTLVQRGLANPGYVLLPHQFAQELATT